MSFGSGLWHQSLGSIIDEFVTLNDVRANTQKMELTERDMRK